MTMAPQKQKEQDEFLRLHHQALEKANILVTEKSFVYNTVQPITELFTSKEEFMYEIGKKVTRIRGALQTPQDARGRVVESLDDSILDAINYLGFLYAWMKMFETTKAETVDMTFRVVTSETPPHPSLWAKKSQGEEQTS